MSCYKPKWKRMLKKSRDIDVDVHIYLAVHFSVTVSSLWPQGVQHARLPCPSPTLGACSNSCPLSWWCHQLVHLVLCHPLLPLSSIFPSIRAFSNESALCIGWSKYWSFSFSISPSHEYSGLIFFRIDCLISLKSTELSRVFSNTTD